MCEAGVKFWCHDLAWVWFLVAFLISSHNQKHTISHICLWETNIRFKSTLVTPIREFNRLSSRRRDRGEKYSLTDTGQFSVADYLRGRDGKKINKKGISRMWWDTSTQKVMMIKFQTRQPVLHWIKFSQVIAQRRSHFLSKRKGNRGVSDAFEWYHSTAYYEIIFDKEHLKLYKEEMWQEYVLKSTLFKLP